MLKKAAKLLSPVHYGIVGGLLLFCLITALFPPKVPQASDPIQTTSKYVNGHTYILFIYNGSISSNHDESCPSMRHK